MPADPLDASGPGSRSLASLLGDLHSARDQVDRLRSGPMTPERLAVAHESLLEAMERYASALTARGLPTPWRLRDQLRLERGIDVHRNRFRP
jgi:hypothetical protein